MKKNVAVQLSEEEFAAFGRKLGPNPYGKKQEVVHRLIMEWIKGGPLPPPKPPKPSAFVELAQRFEEECRDPEWMDTVRSIMLRRVGIKKKSHQS